MEFVCFVLFFCYGVKLTIITHLRHLRGDQYSLVKDFSAFLNFPFGRIIIPLDSIDSPTKRRKFCLALLLPTLKRHQYIILQTGEEKRQGCELYGVI